MCRLSLSFQINTSETHQRKARIEQVHVQSGGDSLVVAGVEVDLLLGGLVPDLAGLLGDVGVEEEELVVHGPDEVEGVVGPPTDHAHALGEGEALLK